MSKNLKGSNVSSKRLAPIILILIGLTASSLAIDYSNLIAALTGITLIFWGVLFIYITPDIYIKREIVDHIVESQQLSKLITGLGYLGDSIYVSPNTVWGLTNCTLFIHKLHEATLPHDEALSEDRMIYDNPQGIKIQAPGSKLSEKIEKILGVTFSSSNLEYLRDNIRKAIVEELEISKDIQMDYEFSKVAFKIYRSIFYDKTDVNDRIIGDPLISALACSTAKITRKPVRIERIEKLDKEKEITVTLKVID